MDQKFEITKYIADQMGLATDPKSLRKLVSRWWQNPREKNNGGLKLTDEGFEKIIQHFKPHRVRFDTDFEYTSQLILRLDNLITCPWYVSKKDLYVFDDKIAVQLILFSGDVVKYTALRAKIANRLDK
jgi:hypothetical protein